MPLFSLLFQTEPGNKAVLIFTLAKADVNPIMLRLKTTLKPIIPIFITHTYSRDKNMNTPEQEINYPGTEYIFIISSTAVCRYRVYVSMLFLG